MQGIFRSWATNAINGGVSSHYLWSFLSLVMANVNQSATDLLTPINEFLSEE